MIENKNPDLLIAQPEDRPTEERPQMFTVEDDGTARFFTVPRTKGEPTKMLHAGRYFTSQGREMAIMHGMQQETFPDGSVGYPEKHVSLELLLAFKRQQQEATLADAGLERIGVHEPATVESAPAVEASGELVDPRIAFLAEPTAEIEVAPAPDEAFDFSHHFIEDEEEYQAIKDDMHAKSAAEADHQRRLKGSRKTTTEDSRQFSMHRLKATLLHSPFLNEAIAAAADGRQLSDTEKVDLMRTDHNLRIKVMTHFLDQINKHAFDFPERVRRNTNKAVSAHGEASSQNLSSREYTARMALDMLSGNFHTSSEDGIVDYDFASGRGVGQHRTAARMLLNGYV